MTTIEGVGKLQDAFEVQSVLGCGAYGRVFLAKIKQSGQVSEQKIQIYMFIEETRKEESFQSLAVDTAGGIEVYYGSGDGDRVDTEPRRVRGPQQFVLLSKSQAAERRGGGDCA